MKGFSNPVQGSHRRTDVRIWRIRALDYTLNLYMMREIHSLEFYTGGLHTL